MARLTIEKRPCTRTMNTVKISGFSDVELNELKSIVATMEHKG